MPQNIRQSDILEIARSQGKVSVEGLASYFDVTVQTIRRDLSDLANAGRLERVHGGAIFASGVSNIQYEERRRLNAEAKQSIARNCAADIPGNAAVFLNIGTTTEAVAQALLGHENLLVVTNNVNIAQILSANDSCQIYLTGGQFRRGDGGVIGGVAVDMIRQFKFDLAVLGCSAIDQDGDILDFAPDEVAVSRMALTRARKSVLVADHSKFQRAAPLQIGGLADLSAIYTDQPLPPPLVQLCVDGKTRVISGA